MEKLGDPFFGGISSHLLLNPVGNALRIDISIGLGLSLLIGIFRNEKTAMIGRTVVAVMVVGWILEIASDITPASHYGYADYADGGDAEEPRVNGKVAEIFGMFSRLPYASGLISNKLFRRLFEVINIGDGDDNLGYNDVQNQQYGGEVHGCISDRRKCAAPPCVRRSQLTVSVFSAMGVPQELIDTILDHLFLGRHTENRVTDMRATALVSKSQATSVDAVELLESLPMLKHLEFGYPASSRPRAMFPGLPPLPVSPQSLDLTSIRFPNLSALEAVLTHGTCLKDLKLRRVVFDDVSRPTSLTFPPPHVSIESLHLCTMGESEVAAKANSGTIEFVRYTSEVASTSPHLLEPFGDLGNLKALKTLTFLHQRWTDWSALVPLLEAAQSLEDIYVYVDASQTFSEHWLPAIGPTFHLRWQ
ncbi:hypothetical protein B0H13DRAFT_1918896 [Mycena leptocephala]|nr:hypothetical protein B0H13DRAFT_1918896 [Mycena leptocephala]